ncbi:MAG: hypothetical protein ACYCU0_02455 [Solirubrobacteraceae bacterium]
MGGLAVVDAKAPEPAARHRADEARLKGAGEPRCLDAYDACTRFPRLARTRPWTLNDSRRRF